MAEAVADQRSRFFCHQCSTEINPKLPEYTCPTCHSGFIEQIAEELEDSNPRTPDPATRFAELWGNSFLDNFRMHADLPEEDNDAGDDQEDGQPSQQQPHQQQHHPHLFRHPPAPFPFFPTPRTRIAIRRTGPVGNGGNNQALQSLIEQLLTGITGGLSGGRGGGLPFGPLTNMYGNPGDYVWGAGGLDNIITQLLNQLEGTGPAPAEKVQIDALPTVSITQEQIDKNVQCSVCMEDFKLAEEVRKLPCQHHYHTDCIVPWLELHGTCPVCRMTLDGKDSSLQEDIPPGGDSNMDDSSSPGPSSGGSGASEETSSDASRPSAYIPDNSYD